MTTIKQSANARLGALRSGVMTFTSYFDNAAGAEHPILSALPRTDTIAMYLRGTTLLNAAACVNSKQVSYDPTRGNDGSLTLGVELDSNSFGLEWGKQITAGLRADTTATTGAALDLGASSSFGAQAYVMLTAFTGTSVTVTIKHATTSGGTYSSLMATTAMNAVGAQRLSVSNATTVNEFLEVVTTGTFTVATFAVVFVQNSTAVVF